MRVLIAFSGFRNLIWLLISAFGMLGSLNFTELDQKGLPNFQDYRNDSAAPSCSAAVFIILQNGAAVPTTSKSPCCSFCYYGFRAPDVCARLRDERTVANNAYTLFGLLYVLGSLISSRRSFI